MTLDLNRTIGFFAALHAAYIVIASDASIAEKSKGVIQLLKYDKEKN